MTHHQISAGLASVAGLLTLVGAAVAFQWTTPLQAEISEYLADIAKSAARGTSPTTMALGALALVAWFVNSLAMGLVLFGVFMLVEVAMEGPPKSWRTTFIAASLQATWMSYVIVIHRFIVLAFPDAWGFEPFVLITQDALPKWLGPIAPISLALISVLVYDFAQYWSHRAQHAIPWLWRFHSVHHSVRDMDSMNSFLHPIDTFTWQFARSTLLAFIVFDFQMLVIIAAALAIHDRFLHTRAEVNFGVLKDVFIDNRHHFIHHSTDERDFDRNFSAWFTLWDRIFGTYAEPRKVSLVTTGLSDRYPPRNLWQFVSARLDPTQSELLESDHTPADPLNGAEKAQTL